MTRSIRAACVLALALSIAGLTACGGDGGDDVSPSLPPTEPTVPVEPPTGLSLPLPAGHDLSAGQFTVQPGASAEHGNVVLSCPTGGGACVVTVMADGTASYDRTGGVPGVTAAYGAWALPANHGLAAGSFTVAPGASAEHGNVVVSCPTGDGACVVTVMADGTASYDRTGGIPSVMASYGPWSLPANHGLAAGEIRVPAGGSEELGNVVVSCPSGGPACMVTVAADGTASYARTGGVPSVMAADRSGPKMAHPEPDPGRGMDHELTDLVVTPGAVNRIVHYWSSADYQLTGMTPVDPFPRQEILDRIDNMLPGVDSVLAIQGRYTHRSSYSTLISCRATECTYDGGFGGGSPVPTHYTALAESDEPFLFDWEAEVYHKNEGPSEQLTPGVIHPRVREVYAHFVNNIQGGQKYGVTLGRYNSPFFLSDDIKMASYGMWLTDSMVIGKHTRGLRDPSFSTRIYFESLGISTGSAPLGSAVWKGQMIGATMQANPVQGDATLTFDTDSTTIDLLFHNIHNLATNTTFRDMSWPNVAVDSMGKFSANHGEYGTISDGRLEGRFYGENHAEVGGVFVSNPLLGNPGNRDRNVVVRGAFGAIKQ